MKPRMRCGISLPKFRSVMAELEHAAASGRNPDLYWIGVQFVTDHYKKVHKDDVVEFDPMFSIAPELSADTDLDSIKKELLELKKLNLRVKTSALKESLQERKKALFNEWSTRFFEIFKASFAKLKTALVDLHLNEEQVNMLESKLELALSSLQDGLTQINADFMSESEEKLEEEE